MLRQDRRQVDGGVLSVEEVILVDDHDNAVGTAEKVRAHQDGGRLHRAFSVFVSNRRGELLLQRRAAGKYHFGGLWSNTCCGHPRPGEEVAAAARRRLGEEFGFTTDLGQVAEFTYKAHDPASGLTEHEYLHVFAGRFDGIPAPDPSEIEDWRWADRAGVESELADAPERYTPWFPLALRSV